MLSMKQKKMLICLIISLLISPALYGAPHSIPIPDITKKASLGEAFVIITNEILMRSK